MKSLIDTWYRRLITGGNSLQSPFLLLVRLYWGWQFAQTGWGKVTNIEKVTGFFTDLGIPAPSLNAHFVSGVELIGGILLAIGLMSRPTGLVLTINMLVAYITADKEALTSFFSDPGKFYGATPYTFLFAALLVLIFGPGKLSADALLTNRWATPPTEMSSKVAAANQG
jgi:putative oxidoreductase